MAEVEAPMAIVARPLRRLGWELACGVHGIQSPLVLVPKRRKAQRRSSFAGQINEFPIGGRVG